MNRKEGPPTHSATVPGHAVRPGVFGPRPPTRASVAPCSSTRIGAPSPCPAVTRDRGRRRVVVRPVEEYH